MVITSVLAYKDDQARGKPLMTGHCMLDIN